MKGPLRGEIRAEFRDPSIFPCQFIGCDSHAAGWVIEPLSSLLEISTNTAGVRVYLCADHLQPAKTGELQTDNED